MNLLARHAELRAELLRIAEGPAAETVTDGPLDVLVTSNEMNDEHGTGFLVKRVLAGFAPILCLRVRDDYGGRHDFGDEARLVLIEGCRRTEVYRVALEALRARPVRRIVVVPYSSEEAMLAVALHDVTGAPICTWVMDDQSVAVDRLPRKTLEELLAKSQLRFATHQELRDAYERAFGVRFFVLPAVVPDRLVLQEPSDGADLGRRGVVLGSIWSRRWLDLLGFTLRGAGLKVDWYGNHRSPLLRLRDEEIAALPFKCKGILPEPALVQELRRRAFAIVPTGTLEGDGESAQAIAALSLPGRILFAAAAAHVPILVLGSEKTPAAAFVLRHGIGRCAPYHPEACRRAVEQLCEAREQVRRRSAALALGPSLSDRGLKEWLEESLARGAPADDRFERLFPREEVAA